MQDCCGAFAVIEVHTLSSEQHRSVDSAFSKQSQEVRSERHVSPITDIQPRITTFDFIVDTGGRYRRPGPDRRFQQRGMERKHTVTSGTGTFREKHNPNAISQSLLDLLRNAPGIGLAFAVHVDRPAVRGEPSENGPLLHLRFGDENARSNRTEAENIEIAKVVGNDKAVSR